MAAQAFARHTHNGCSGGVLFKAAVPTTAARGAVDILDDEVPGFAAHPCEAIPDLAVEDEAVADPCAERKDAERAEVVRSAGTELRFGQGGGVGVAGELNGPAQGVFHGGPQVEAVPVVQVGRVAKDTGRQFQRPGGAKAHTDERARGVSPFCDSRNRCGDVLHHGVAALRQPCPQMQGFQEADIRCVGGNAEISSSEVHTHRVRCAHVAPCSSG